jgi:two-component system, NarL family, sensor histidine kinase UhpB
VTTPWKAWWLQRWQKLTTTITAQVVMVALVPTVLVFLGVGAALYFLAQADVRADVQARGHLMAAALAQSSQYGVVSGNRLDLEKTLHGLRAVDNSLVHVAVRDVQGELLAQVGAEVVGADFYVFEAPVYLQLLEMDGAGLEAPASTQGPLLGVVRVVTSAQAIEAAKRRHLAWAALAVVLGAAFSAVVGLGLAQRLRKPLAWVMGSLRDVRGGSYALAAPTHQGGEVGELQKAIVQMAQALSEQHANLESQVLIRTQQLQQTQTQLRALMAQGHRAVEEERQRMAIEIHDHLNAELVGMRLQAQHMGALAAQANMPEMQNLAQGLSSHMQSLYGATRAIVKQLRPEMLDVLGVQGAIGDMVKRYERLHPTCEFKLEVAPSFPVLQGVLVITAFRLVQEALSNTIKHAKATKVSVRLAGFPDGAALVEVSDNGCGFDAKVPHRGSLGVVGMRERVFACGGRIEFVSAPGQGTVVSAVLPSFSALSTVDRSFLLENSDEC